jgi:YD repeat-containing protein
LSDGTLNLSYNASDRITNSGFVYDANGNLLSDGSTSYAYDAVNRMISTTFGTTTTLMAYDGFGHLISKIVAEFDHGGWHPHRSGMPGLIMRMTYPSIRYTGSDHGGCDTHRSGIPGLIMGNGIPTDQVYRV